MKKLLSILAAAGLTATASSAVVACSSSKKSDDKALTPDADGNIKKTWDVVAKDAKSLAPIDFNATVKLDGTAIDSIKPAIAVEAKKDGDKAVKDTFVLTVTVNVKDLAKDKDQSLEIEVKSTDNNANIKSAFDETIKATIPAKKATVAKADVTIQKAVTTDGKTIELTLDKAVSDTKAITKDDFKVAVTKAAAPKEEIQLDVTDDVVTEVKVDGTKVTITLTTALVKGDTATITAANFKNANTAINVDVTALNK